MRLYQNRGTYHCSLSGSGNRRISLRTKDRSEATIRASLIEKEIDMILIYSQIVKEHHKILRKIEKHNSNIIRMIETFENNKNGKTKAANLRTYETEESLQNAIIPFLQDHFNFRNIVSQKVGNDGIIDLFGYRENKRIGIEVKLGSLSDKYLGQCLRYLKDKLLALDELWLIGEEKHRSTGVYADFKKIKLYITTKSYRAKKLIKKIEAKHTK